jgi:hypothetical protein
VRLDDSLFALQRGRQAASTTRRRPRVVIATLAQPDGQLLAARRHTRSPAPDADDPTGWKAAETLIGFIEDAPADMAEKHDHYLYGQPKA